ncbi:MAG: hypothetical protein ABSF94_11350 [Steroidobacteraceae bacterium]|jgi:hypothetical protein
MNRMHWIWKQSAFPLFSKTSRASVALIRLWTSGIPATLRAPLWVPLIVSAAVVASLGNSAVAAEISVAVPQWMQLVITGNIQSANGSLLLATNGGGIGGPNSGNTATALHTDATKQGPWELFTLVKIDSTHFALQTADGHYVTAVNGGGIGNTVAGSDAVQSIVTNGNRGGASHNARFSMHLTANGKVTLTTYHRRYVTAVNGGGVAGPNDVPIHTDATTLGPWETFTWVPILMTDIPINSCGGKIQVPCPPPRGNSKNNPGTVCTLTNSLSSWNSDVQCGPASSGSLGTQSK